MQFDKVQTASAGEVWPALCAPTLCCSHELLSRLPVITASIYALSVPSGVDMLIGCLISAPLKPASKVPPEKRGIILLCTLPVQHSSLLIVIIVGSSCVTQPLCRSSQHHLLWPCRWASQVCFRGVSREQGMSLLSILPAQT